MEQSWVLQAFIKISIVAFIIYYGQKPLQDMVVSPPLDFGDTNLFGIPSMEGVQESGSMQGLLRLF